MIIKPPYTIQIEVVPTFLPRRSAPQHSRYAFSYTVTIHNSSPVAIQLIRRQWTITSDNGSVQQVQGDGVLGEQPRLEPEQAFTYSSWAMLETPTGQMEGRYYFETDTEEGFWTDVPMFFFEQPGARVLN